MKERRGGRDCLIIPFDIRASTGWKRDGGRERENGGRESEREREREGERERERER